MSYDFNKSDGTPVSIPDGQITSNLFSIDLIGRNTQGYGLAVARTLVHMLENFSSATEPAFPTEGQLWYDKGTSVLKVYDGTNWVGVGGGAVTGDILPATNCVGGVGVNIGSPTLQFCNVYANTFNGTATSARYADLAERYEADTEYTPGTALILGGAKEVTAAKRGNGKIFGIVSTNPAYLMNAEAGDDKSHPPVALKGRVPAKVVGAVKKFDRLTPSDILGHLEVAKTNDPVVAVALSDKNDDGLGLVEVVIGDH